ncbi:FHA domain-containing protein [Heliobacillus mobilis]|uniref:FHA domain-containing protein n=1 Tax=Heliobacterium mobile TaxID=28064 RepID=A0A6I3SHG8_HELMO|nr:FHA domain-containing protein [Heliobacterium mobile]MTV48314.1 FHA domain-containing protein [Heliobacterium mobile]
MKRCSNGHYYDPQMHSTCPYCGIENFDPSVTRPLSSGTFPYMEVPPTQPKRPDYGVPSLPQASPPAWSQPQTPQREQIPPTRGVTQVKGYDRVVGWLVCVEGAELGKDYRLHSEKNFIGRSEKMDVVIRADETISRENHAIVSYDPKKNSFRLHPGDGRGLVYINGEEVTIPVPIQAYDMIEIGETTLQFVPFCGDRFQWKKDKA